MSEDVDVRGFSLRVASSDEQQQHSVIQWDEEPQTEDLRLILINLSPAYHISHTHTHTRAAAACSAVELQPPAAAQPPRMTGLQGAVTRSSLLPGKQQRAVA